jgi:hypothetical protein
MNLDLLKKGRSLMRFAQLTKILPPRLGVPRMALNPHSAVPVPWRVERKGNFAGYTVSGWRYSDLAIWHLKVWPIGDDSPEQTYIVSVGEFYPESIAPAERFAALRLIGFWEADGFT